MKQDDRRDDRDDRGKEQAVKREKGQAVEIGGFQKLTLLDYPDQMACIVFTDGCNFRCPFCQNSGLVTGRNAATGAAETEVSRMNAAVAEEDVLKYLQKRRGLLDGVVLSGGEPLLQAGLTDFIREIRKLGYLVKLDTNGSFPGRLQALLSEGLLDYVAMDIKSAPDSYAAAAGIEADLSPEIGRSIALLQEGKIPFEFRTTLVKGIHRLDDVRKISAWIAGGQPYYLQSYSDEGDILSPRGLSAFSEEETEAFLSAARERCPNARLRKRL